LTRIFYEEKIIEHGKDPLKVNRENGRRKEREREREKERALEATSSEEGGSYVV